MNEKLRDLYKPPFRLGPYDRYVFDSLHNTVADFNGDGGGFRVRGWGRFQYLEDGDKIHDQMEALLLYIVGNEKDPHKIVGLLNAAWKEGQ